MKKQSTIPPYFTGKDREEELIREHVGASRMLFIVFAIMLAIVTFIIVYVSYSKILESRIENSSMSEEYLTEMAHQIIADVKVGIEVSEGVIKYAPLDEIPSGLVAGDTIDVFITYDDKHTEEKKGYITSNSDANETEIQYNDGDYFQLILPQNYFSN